MNKFLESIKNKKVRYGTFSTLMIVIVIAILVIINLVVDRLNLSFDMTSNKKYSLSTQSKDLLANVDMDITIYALVRSGEENNMFANGVGASTFKELLQEYQNSNKHISVVYKDPYLYPQFAVKYEENGASLPVNTVIVESAKRFRVLNPGEMITTDFDQQTWQQYVKSIEIEPRITNAINYVTADNTPVIYTFTNSGDLEIPEGLRNQITLANFEIKNFDVLIEDIPEDCAILFLTQPPRDWTETAANKVREFLQGGGKALFVIGYYFTDMPNFTGVLETYGVTQGKYLVIEGDQKNYLSSPLYLLPNTQQHDITAKLTDKNNPFRTLFFQCSGIEALAVKKQSITIEPLLTTSAQAYGRVNPENQMIAKQPDDVSGPINVAVAVTDSFYTNEQHITKLVILASAYALDESYNNAIDNGNYMFITGAINWLQGKSGTVYIPSKTPSSYSQLVMTQQQTVTLVIFSVFVVPVAILAIGLTVWLRRRYS